MTEFPDFYNYLGECNGDTILSKKTFFMMVDTNPDDVKDLQTRLEMVRYEAVDKYGIPEDEFARWLGDMNDLWLKDEASFRQCETSGKPLNLVKASVVTYEPPRWLIPPYFQRGKGTLIQGDNGSGKTAFMCAIAAHVSTGRPLLGIPIEGPGPVLILSVEDDLPILRGRIEANGGDLDKCYFLGNAADLTFNSPEVEAAIQRCQAVMVIFDPFQAFLGAKVDMFRANAASAGQALRYVRTEQLFLRHHRPHGQGRVGQVSRQPLPGQRGYSGGHAQHFAAHPEPGET